MNLINFLNKVDQMTAAAESEQLRSFIHETARVLPNSERQNYISRLENISRSSKSKDNQLQDEKNPTIRKTGRAATTGGRDAGK